MPAARKTLPESGGECKGKEQARRKKVSRNALLDTEGAFSQDCEAPPSRSTPFDHCSSGDRSRAASMRSSCSACLGLARGSETCVLASRSIEDSRPRKALEILSTSAIGAAAGAHHSYFKIIPSLNSQNEAAQSGDTHMNAYMDEHMNTHRSAIVITLDIDNSRERQRERGSAGAGVKGKKY